MLAALEKLLLPLKKYEQILKIKIEALPIKKYVSRYLAHQYDMIYISLKPDYDESYMILKFIADETYGPPGINKNKYNNLLQKSLLMNKKDQRALLYSQFNEKIMETYSVIPLFHGEKGNRYVRKEIVGMTMPFLGYYHLSIAGLKRRPEKKID
jgi:ABC-type transport system substrate-binding protein